MHPSWTSKSTILTSNGMSVRMLVLHMQSAPELRDPLGVSLDHWVIYCKIQFNAEIFWPVQSSLDGDHPHIGLGPTFQGSQSGLTGRLGGL